ncbi:metal-dependent transcriptional regulator [uncultured Varibaculum sp.]|uniref:metal-dependent transcriptional regulator n=1 Tax=uncultured Varibaculum sp. TaxID=413896 RepID=UPI00288C0F84|nr:metal-dependent transcriptional regulator [uncultured Varibaculum sp.]
MGDLVDTTEMYLKTVYEMLEDGVPPLRARIVERLDHSGPTVSQTVARMERDGLLYLADNRRIEFTDQGVELAREVVRKHRLAERLLLDLIGLDWVMVHDEACRWEHVMSDAVEMRLLDLLHHPSTDPYGNPIPDGHDGIEGAGTSVSQIVEQYGGIVATKIVRIGEPIQAEPRMLEFFDEAGILPGREVNLQPDNGRIAVMGVDTEKTVLLDTSLGQHLFVEGVSNRD